MERPPHPLHSDGRLDLRGHGVDAGRHTQPVQALVLLADGVLGVNSCTLHILLLESLEIHSSTP